MYTFLNIDVCLGYDKLLESNLVFNEIEAKELLKIAISSLKFQLKQNQIQLKCNLKYSNIQLKLDVEKSSQVLFNVIGNSISKFHIRNGIIIKFMGFCRIQSTEINCQCVGQDRFRK